MEVLPEPLPPDAEFVGLTLKVASRCNIACLGCYEYLEGNDAWKEQPRFMPPEVVEKAAERLDEYALAHGRDEVFVTLHGGEPLLLGPAGIAERARIIRDTVSRKVYFGIQTNGLLLDERMAEVLSDYDFRVGLSLDGGQTANDRHRLGFGGGSTYLRVLQAVNVLQKSALQWGLLAVIDLRNPPLETYHSLVEHQPPLGIDFLFPHGNWADPPPYRDESDETPYANWLIPIFDKYINSTELPLPIRKFDAIIRLALGQSTLTESLGNPPPRQVFVRPDGGYEDVDTLLSAYAGAPTLDMDVFGHSLEDVAEHPWMKFRRMGRASLSQTCQSCELVSVCGGGYIPHRYGEAKASDDPSAYFDNPSVYCNDLKKLITYILRNL